MPFESPDVWEPPDIRPGESRMDWAERCRVDREVWARMYPARPLRRAEPAQDVRLPYRDAGEDE